MTATERAATDEPDRAGLEEMLAESLDLRRRMAEMVARLTAYTDAYTGGEAATDGQPDPGP